MSRSLFLLATSVVVFTCNAQLMWQQTTSPVNTLLHLALGPNGELVTFQNGSPIQPMISTDKGQTWQTRPGTGGPNSMLIFDQRWHVTHAGSMLFFGNTGITSAMWRSDDGGNTFSLLTGSGLPTNRFFFGFMSAPNGDVYMYGEGAIRSQDDGLTWASVVTSSVNITALTATDANLFGVNGGDMQKGMLDGTGYAAITTQTTSVGSGMGITATPSDRVIAVGATDRVITTTDGVNWSLANYGLSAAPAEFNRIAAARATDKWIAAKQISVRFTADAGANWVVAENGLNLAQNEPILGAFCDSSETFYIYNYSGVYRLDAATVVPETGQEEELDVYPNPARGFIFLPKTWAGSTVHVFDALGRDAMSARTDQRGALDLRKLDAGEYVIRTEGTKRAIRIQVEH